MNTNSTKKQEIDLRDLIFSILHKWRLILIIGVCFAVILGGLKFISNYKTQSNTEFIEQAQIQYDTNLKLYENNRTITEQEIENLKKDIEMQQKYMENSILMNMSPYDIKEATANIFIKTDFEIMPGMLYQNVDYTDTVIQAYQSIISNAAFWKKIADKSGIEERYLQELVSIERIGTTIDGADVTKLTNLLTIQVHHYNEAEAKNILQYILSETEALQSSITNSIGQHELHIVDKSYGTVIDLDLANVQKDASKRLTDLQTLLNEKEKYVKDLVKPTGVTSPIKTAIKQGVKYGILGGVLGSCIAVFLACIIFLLSDKLYSGQELRKCFNIKILGMVSLLNKKTVKGIDAWLNRMEGIKPIGNSEQQYDLISANLVNYASNIDTLLIVSMVSEEQLQIIQENLSERLPDKKILCGYDMLHFSETLKMLPQCEGIILVEQTKFSTLSIIEEEIILAQTLGKEIVGCIVLE
ncbi:hypothetical protein [Clostridium sp. AN503]|uniref:hypothetical protein n=1 Tax=Clostridium sp. AN503 TaxID=3160598 RepID=UPI003459CC99